MSWVVGVLAFLVALGGLGVLAVFGWRLYRQVRHLGGTVAKSSERIAEAAAGLDQLTPPRGVDSTR